MRGREVKPRRAREAFWRWEQAFARWTRDMGGFFLVLFFLRDLWVYEMGRRLEAESEILGKAG